MAFTDLDGIGKLPARRLHEIEKVWPKKGSKYSRRYRLNRTYYNNEDYHVLLNEDRNIIVGYDLYYPHIIVCYAWLQSNEDH